MRKTCSVNSRRTRRQRPSENIRIKGTNNNFHCIVLDYFVTLKLVRAKAGKRIWKIVGFVIVVGRSFLVCVYCCGLCNNVMYGFFPSCAVVVLLAWPVM